MVNWKKGYRRIALSLSVPWVLFFVGHSINNIFNGNFERHPEWVWEMPAVLFGGLALVWVGIPWLVYCLKWFITWIITGFTDKPEGE